MTFFVLLFAEYVSYLKLKKSKNNFGFFYLLNSGDKIKIHKKQFKYGYLDPFLGWGYRSSEILKNGYKVKDNLIVLNNSLDSSTDTLSIYISGGSTSDILFTIDNWPIHLFSKLKSENISFILYVAAVGGYGSSQELLKYMRDGSSISPDIVISYHGANEFNNPYYVNKYSQDIYNDYVRKSKTTKLFPNLIYVVRNIIGLNNYSLELHPIPKEANKQYEKNMKTFKVLAEGYGFNFYGILQPVAGIAGLVTNDYNEFQNNNIQGYLNFYPKALKFVNEHDYMHDFTNIFHHDKNPFMDECHLKSEFQHLIADSVYVIIKEHLTPSKIRN